MYLTVEERVKTFGSWPKHMPLQVTPYTLADAGFIYVGPNDKVQCVFCRGCIHRWEENDVPIKEHIRHFPTCSFVRERIRARLTSIPGVYYAEKAGYSITTIEKVIEKDPSLVSKAPVLILESCMRYIPPFTRLEEDEVDKRP